MKPFALLREEHLFSRRSYAFLARTFAASRHLAFNKPLLFRFFHHGAVMVV